MNHHQKDYYIPKVRDNTRIKSARQYMNKQRINHFSNSNLRMCFYKTTLYNEIKE